MKIKAFDCEQPPLEKIVNLRLVSYGMGVQLMVVDDAGDLKRRGLLLTFSDNGTVSTHGSIDPEFGLPLDNGRLKLN